ncbi:glycosyltransferase family 25 protein [Spongiibacter sp. KMU-158]|uniref:Glycosyltransferase family 25 protein n=1 Tax=Spongiibacter pelagi TaxID=2760804 RepID=A0A927C176_9GAMM|nr:glycosyltransferase family 25 protein [Spongiibacter pelagi]MBD2859379.1 glycosyltransferase family 25 protein [Spongiibacter pelagi]
MQKTLACWVISLNVQAENTQKLLIDLAEQGLEPTIFPAVDGRKQRPELQPDERFSEFLAMVRHKHILTNSELGCYLSHLRGVRKAYDSGYDYVCLIEDDVVIEPRFAEVVNCLMDDELDLVRLMALKVRRRKILKDLVGEHQLVRPERGTLGTQAYLMSRAGMKKFLDHGSVIYEQIDGVYDHFFLYNLNMYCVEPHVCYELDNGSNIARFNTENVKKPSFVQRLLFHPVKLWFSLRRHYYLNRRRSEFYPAEMPVNNPGKSPRMRRKKR